MKKIVLNLSNNIDFSEFRKVICFISEAILSFEFDDSTSKLTVALSDAGNEERIKNDIINQSNKYVNEMPEELVYQNGKDSTYYNEFLNIFKFADGVYGFSKESVFLYKYFEKQFIELAKEINGEEKIYPVLLPIKAYQKTNYLKTSPQYSLFCYSCCEDLSLLKNINDGIENNDLQYLTKFTNLALSPSACFHVYAEYENRTLDGNKVFTFTQDVFRNEGRLNYTEIGRLKSYHVREIVFIGSSTFVSESRMKLINKTKELLEKLALRGKICLANDPFIMPVMQNYKKIQRYTKVKYEVKLAVGKNKFISAGSYNLHHDAFTNPFNICVEDVDQPVSGCVGFGIERWVYAFLSQFGNDYTLWPRQIKEDYLNGQN